MDGFLSTCWSVRVTDDMGLETYKNTFVTEVLARSTFDQQVQWLRNRDTPYIAKLSKHETDHVEQMMKVTILEVQGFALVPVGDAPPQN